MTALFLNGFGQMLVAGLPVLAYEQYDGSSRVAGAFFAAFGAGGGLGSVVAMRIVPRYDPIGSGRRRSSPSRCRSGSSRSTFPPSV